jgi:hypothetical protein
MCNILLAGGFPHHRHRRGLSHHGHRDGRIRPGVDVIKRLFFVTDSLGREF